MGFCVPFERFVVLMIRAVVYRSQELVWALALIAFGLFGDDVAFVQNFDNAYPDAAVFFHTAFVTGGLLMLAAIWKPMLMFSAWVYSGLVAFACLVMALGIPIPPNDVLYTITWLLLFLLSVAQGFRHFGGDESGA